MLGAIVFSRCVRHSPMVGLAAEHVVATITRDEVESIIVQISNAGLQSITHSAVSALTPLVGDAIIIWSMPGGSYWPINYIAHKELNRTMHGMITYCARTHNGPLHFLSAAEFFEHTCDRINSYEGHWNLTAGDNIRRHAIRLTDPAARRECMQRAKDRRSCVHAYRYEAQYTLVFQGKSANLSFGLIPINGKWVISDIASSDQCDL